MLATPENSLQKEENSSKRAGVLVHNEGRAHMLLRVVQCKTLLTVLEPNPTGYPRDSEIANQMPYRMTITSEEWSASAVASQGRRLAV